MHEPWLYAFALTHIVEAPFYFFALGKLGPERPTAERALLALLPSALTHPLLWFGLFPAVFEKVGYWPAVGIGEAVVVVIEALILLGLTRCPPLKALGWAFLANGTSVGLGFASSALFGWP